MSTVERIKSVSSGRGAFALHLGHGARLSSDESRIILQKAGGHYILGEKPRNRQAAHKEALSFQDQYQKFRENLKVKEIVVGQGKRRRRFVLVFNPEQAKKDKVTRDKTLQRIEETIQSLRDPEGPSHKRTVCALLSHWVMGRFVRQTKTGKLRINLAKVQEEEALDGKYLLSTSEDTLSAEDVALGYKQLMEVERAFRTLKAMLELRPLYHRKDERIEAHVLLCYISLLLVRIAERETGETWDHIRSVMERCHLGDFSSKDGGFRQLTELTPDQVNILNRLKIAHPPALYDVQLRV